MSDVPDSIRAEIRARLAKLADEVGWLALSPIAKSRHYENWTKDPAIGGRLSRYRDVSGVRHYIKDALMKVYSRERQGDERAILPLAGIPGDSSVRRTFIKPRGCELEDGRIVCWGRADSWKQILMAVYERSYDRDGVRPHGAVLTQAAAHFADEPSRAVVKAAAGALGISSLAWRLD
jgi:hypothetical protein